MTEQQAPCPGLLGDKGCLARCAVIIDLGTVLILRGIGAFVIEHRHVFYSFIQVGQIARIAAVGITAGCVGWLHQPAVGHDVALGCRPVSAVLDVVDLRERNAVIVYHVATDVRQGGLLAEDVATAGYTMAQRHRLYGDGMVFVNHFLLGCIYGNKLYFIGHALHKEVHLLLKQAGVTLWC